MIIVEKNEGQKIKYKVNGSAICFDGKLAVNCAEHQQDWDVHIDVCADADGNLVIGTEAGRAYVAEIDIPARAYEQGEPSGEDDQPPMMALPLDMDAVKLSLWAVE